ncbi:purine catabolism regulator [Murinocardiopsis flavida]|uniref:Purine catabolism regulator n=1 Tax=Murinocardiopsis flavida TaxID=645275 RepID=A0A2P8CT14_9ACTN|nr:PucR family transcriptional regulator [Murinocardiopsis flavida]PSK88090.1 purine catabolism regulator [Murinocardiopsis flavida]
MPTMPTLGAILDLPILRQGRPEVLSGADALSRAVRWVHVSELDEFSALLQGGELVLTTGLGLGSDTDSQQRYVHGLDRVGACGVVLELGRRFTEPPAGLRRAGQRLGFPVVVLHRPIRFVEVTEQVHSAIVADQLQRLRFSHDVHRTFSSLSAEHTSIPRILAHTRALAGAPVVLEDMGHRVLDYDLGDAPAATALRHWERRSRDAADTGVSRPLGNERWTAARVESAGQAWGRLIVLGSGPLDDADAAMLLERAAQALALARLLERDRQGVEQRAHSGFLSELLGGRGGAAADLGARAAALGLPSGARFTALTLARRGATAGPPPVEPITAGLGDTRVAEAAAAAARGLRVPALVGSLALGSVHVLVSHAEAAHADRDLDRLAAAVHDRLAALPESTGEWVIGAARPAGTLGDAGRRLAESAHIARAAATLPERGAARPIHRTEDVRLRGLIALLHDDPRVEAFAAAELAPLRDHDAEHGTALFGLLTAFVRSGGNKTRLARAAHLSRAALYHRLASIEEVLGVDLADPETVTSLHVAVLVHEMRT